MGEETPGQQADGTGETGARGDGAPEPGAGAQSGSSSTVGSSGTPPVPDNRTPDATPPATPTGHALKLTQEQIERLLKYGTLEMTDDHYSGAVRERISQLTARAKTAEKKLGEITSAQEEAERKSLEEQARYKELYEKERQGREAESAARKDDLVRSRFLLSATKAGVVDPDVAFVVAKSLPGFAMVGVDDDGKVSGIDELVEMLTKDKPYLVAAKEPPKPQSVGAPSNPGPQTPPAPKSLAEAGDRLEQALRTGVG